MESESAGGSKAIECVAVCPAGRGDIVFPLIEIDPCLLAGSQIGVEGNAVHGDLDRWGRSTHQWAATEWELFFRSNGGVVALPDAARRKELFQELNNQRLGAIHSLGEGLQNERVGILVD